MFVADLHNDLTQRMMLGEDVTKQTSLGHTDIVRLKKSSIDLQVLIIWVSGLDSEIGYFELAKKMYQKLESLSLIDTAIFISVQMKRENLQRLPIMNLMVVL